VITTLLVTLLSAFGTLKHTLRLVGGLVPRYLTPANPPEVPVHFGTSDVDIVLNLQLIAEGEGYASLSEQLKEKGFVRYEGSNGWSVAWRWVFNISDHEKVRLLKSVLAVSHYRKGVYNRINQIRSDLDDLASRDYNYDELPNEQFMKLYYRGSGSTFSRSLSIVDRDHHIATLEQVKKLLIEYFPDSTVKKGV
jgi:hypothetical protein